MAKLAPCPTVAALAWLAVTGAAAAADLGPTPAPTPAPSSNAYLFNLLYTGEAWDVASGGLRTGGSFMYNVDGQLQVDTGKAFGWTGGTFFLEGFFANGVSSSSKYVGSLDQISPIDTAAGVNIFRLYQIYYDQNFGSTDVRFGIYDLETEFANTKPMALFLNKNLTWNTAFDQSGAMPSNGTVGPGNYPYTPLALRIRHDFSHDFSLQFALANGAADNPNNLADNAVIFRPQYGVLALGEADYTPIKYTKIFAGGWGLTSQLPVWGRFNADGSQRQTWGEGGGYVGATTRLIEISGRRGLDAFFSYGASTPESTNVAQSLNAGFSLTGPFAARPDDKLGVAFTLNNASSYWKQAQALQGVPIGNYETNWELTYRAKLNEYVTIQPDIQYVTNPAYSTTIKNPLVWGLHFEIGRVFEW